MSIAVSVKVVGRVEEETHFLSPGTRIVDLLKELDRNPETLVVKLNEKIVPEGEKLEDGDKIEIIPVVSGG